MTKIPAARVVFGIPVVSQLERRRSCGCVVFFIARRAQKVIRKAPFLTFNCFDEFKTQQVAIEMKRGVDVRDSNHCMKIAHENSY